MTPYNTRSAARKRALETYEDEDVIISPSATGKGTHTRWTYPPGEEVPYSGSPEPSSDRPMSPDQDEDEEFQRSPTACSIEISDERTPPTVEDHEPSAAERAVMERMLAQLQEQKKATEERAAAKALEFRNNPQPKSDRPTNKELLDPSRPRPPLGVTGFGRTGTWVAENVWRPTFVSSTDQLPSVREVGEEEEVQDLPLNDVEVIQEDPGENPGFRMLTPFPSFVTGNGGAGMK